MDAVTMRLDVRKPCGHPTQRFPALAGSTKCITQPVLATFSIHTARGVSEREFKRAIELNPSYAYAHRHYGAYLITMNRMEEALREVKRAQRLDPLSVIVQFGIAEWFFAKREFGRALSEYQKASETHSD